VDTLYNESLLVALWTKATVVDGPVAGSSSILLGSDLHLDLVGVGEVVVHDTRLSDFVLRRCHSTLTVGDPVVHALPENLVVIPSVDVEDVAVVDQHDLLFVVHHERKT
jgi:hypothetical protein